jgi:hypothetical protein
MTTHKGECFCGSVQIKVTGAPEAMGYCHCSSCRSWSAAPINAFALWKPENVKVTKGNEFIGLYMKTKLSDRQFCRLPSRPSGRRLRMSGAEVPQTKH